MKRDYKRGPNDEKWKELVSNVRERDRMCRLMRILKVSEMYTLKYHAPGHVAQILDPAHVVQVSAKPSMRYDEDNVVLLNRFSHENLDNNRCPITGKPIPRIHVHQWWSRIVGMKKYRELLERANKPSDMEEE